MNIKDLVPFIDKIVMDNSTLLMKDDLGRDYLLHVSREKIKNNKFVPRIARSQAKQENRTFLRVNVAPNLIDCINAIANIQYDFASDLSDVKSNKYYIYALPYEYVLKPNTKLVYDSDFTDELWLFTYSEDTKSFKGVLIGEFYVSEINIKPIKGEKYIYNDKDVTFNCYTEKPIFIDDKNQVEGYFSFKFNINREDNTKQISQLTKGIYTKEKNLSSALEAEAAVVPSWVGW